MRRARRLRRKPLRLGPGRSFGLSRPRRRPRPGGVSLAKLILELRERFREPLGVGVETAVRNLDGLPPGELLQAIRQVSGLRHCRAVDQDRNDGNIAFERRLDLDADEVARIVEAAPVLTVGARNPMLADDGQEHVALADALGKDINKIEAGRDRVHIEKDILASQPVRQTIIDPPRETAGILSPIADEDAA